MEGLPGGVTGVTDWKMFRRSPPPHISFLLPEQGMLQAVRATEEVGFSKESAQKHWELYSTPK